MALKIIGIKQVHALRFVCRVRTVRAREAAVPEDLLFGTLLFVCAKNWVVRHSRSVNVHEGPWAGWAAVSGKGLTFAVQSSQSRVLKN